MIRLPQQLSEAQRSTLAAYRAALSQNQLPLSLGEEEAEAVRLDFAFALGVTCGIELQRMAPFCPMQQIEVEVA